MLHLVVMSKEQMEASMNNLRLAFTKFDSLIKTIVEREQINEGG